MPLRRDPLGGGTEADGSRSAKYCGYCYQRGQFVMPDITVEQMQARARDKLREFHVPGFLAAFLTRHVPKLERWRQPGS